MAVTMKTTVLWDMMPCGSCKNRRVGGVYCLYHQDGQNERARSNVNIHLQWESIASYCWHCFYLADFFTLMMEAIYSSETSVLKRATRRHIPEYCIPHVM
jgi:hypothetical protein